MKHAAGQTSRFFFATSLLPCPYLPGRIERRIVTELVGRDVDRLHDALTLAGYRRSHAVAYAPACPDCDACVPARIVVAGHRPGRTRRRIARINADLVESVVPPESNQERFELFNRYQRFRHATGDMARMDHFDFQTLIEDTPVRTFLLELRDREGGALRACCLVDRLGDGLSAVYSFFDPEMARRGLGTHMIALLVARAQREGLSHVYLGFWIGACRKMAYKIGFQPLEGFRDGAWMPLTPATAAAFEST